ncbi:hypothetical protein Pelo_11266 [Pelomyxa schiedti]|nr:hypothetical protein Pelo_11266 [Pelomyxa schiedti]
MSAEQQGPTTPPGLSVQTLWVLTYQPHPDHKAISAPYLPQHFAHLRAASDEGKLLLGGLLVPPPPRPDGAPAYNDAALCVFSTQEGAEAFARADPLVIHGAVLNWFVRQWNICWYVDAGGLLFVVHAPPDSGNIHITRVDPGSLAILQTWVVPRAKRQTGYMRLLCVGGSTLERHTTAGRSIGVNSLPTSGTYVLLTSWIPSTNQLLVVDRIASSEYDFFIFDDVSL